jgi:hypothetical protein
LENKLLRPSKDNLVEWGCPFLIIARSYQLLIENSACDACCVLMMTLSIHAHFTDEKPEKLKNLSKALK